MIIVYFVIWYNLSRVCYIFINVHPIANTVVCTVCNIWDDKQNICYYSVIERNKMLTFMCSS